jgi:hypothetical protein
VTEPRILSDEEVAEIRDGVRSGLRGPVQTKWLGQLLADRDARVARDAEKATPEGVRGRYFLAQRRKALEV